MSDLKYLFIDFNAYFAAVEQNDDRAAQGRPLIVVPLKSEHTSAIAASYEARKFGINRGTSVREARQLCPGIIIRHARHDRYVQVHKKLKEEVERHLPITKVYSIDEWACRLAPSETARGPALAIGRQVQQGILENIGPSMRSSIGLAPSRLLAKLAAESHKPDGLTALESSDLPHTLEDIRLSKIPGIGPGILKRLERAGVTDFMGVWNLQPKQARRIWGSVQGERFWYSLHGHEVYEDDAPQKSMIGHSRVLGGEHETAAGARIVVTALLMKAASRLRHYDRFAGALTVNIRMRAGRHGPGGRWGGTRRFALSQDTYGFLDAVDDLWRGLEQQRDTLRDGNGGGRFGNVSVFLHDLAVAGDAKVMQGDLFTGQSATSRQESREKLWTALDEMNADLEKRMAKLGGAARMRPSTGRYVTLASQMGLDLNYLGAKIAFSRVPEEAEFLF
ncbi:hypothetical protein [Parvularcula sp. IMCC14364]|uniref:Y-family DNA polymerase n=1 Tax=Parvularcula sp. IMCC14364 TaxID=3067902 RepID=UPI0027413DF8|nr:hypothetical protein [Parvularcula sp. IMCC14364]